ncbi:MAG: zeta toxin family protein, partial [Candidatus Binataceae bacterium]
MDASDFEVISPPTSPAGTLSASDFDVITPSRETVVFSPLKINAAKPAPGSKPGQPSWMRRIVREMPIVGPAVAGVEHGLSPLGARILLAGAQSGAMGMPQTPAASKISQSVTPARLKRVVDRSVAGRALTNVLTDPASLMTLATAGTEGPAAGAIQAGIQDALGVGQEKLDEAMPNHPLAAQAIGLTAPVVLGVGVHAGLSDDANYFARLALRRKLTRPIEAAEEAAETGASAKPISPPESAALPRHRIFSPEDLEVIEPPSTDAALGAQSVATPETAPSTKSRRKATVPESAQTASGPAVHEVAHVNAIDGMTVGPSQSMTFDDESEARINYLRAREQPGYLGAIRETNKDGTYTVTIFGTPATEPGAAAQAQIGSERQTFLDQVAQRPDVRQARAALGDENATTKAAHTDENGDYTPEAQAEHAQIAERIINPNSSPTPGEKPILRIVMGGPGSGKSSVIAGMPDADRFTILDNDRIKEQIPGYDPKLADLAHDESADVAEKEILPRLLNERRNVIYDTTGKNTQRILQVARTFKQDGYNVEVTHVDLPPLAAARRAMARFEATGRFVDPEYTLNEVGAKPLDTFHQLQDSGIADKVEAYDNNVAQGEPPRKLSEAEIRSRRGVGFGGSEGSTGGNPPSQGAGGSGAGVPPSPNGAQGPLSPPAGGGSPPPDAESGAASAPNSQSSEPTATALNALEATPGAHISRVPVTAIKTAPERFQYKLNSNAEGAGLALNKSKRFNPRLAGVVTLLPDETEPGKFWIVNGHQRLALAKRTGQDVLNAQILAPGTTDEEARAIGARINIAEGRGTAVDAAKFMRDSGATPEELAGEGIDLNESMASDAVALRNLAKPLFRDVTLGRMRPARGVIIGRQLPDNQPAQEAIYHSIRELEDKGRDVTDAKFAEMIRIVKGAGNSTETQTDLFGTHQLEKSFAPEQAGI